jgi:hypothetical protein
MCCKACATVAIATVVVCSEKTPFVNVAEYVTLPSVMHVAAIATSLVAVTVSVIECAASLRHGFIAVTVE